MQIRGAGIAPGTGLLATASVSVQPAAATQSQTVQLQRASAPPFPDNVEQRQRGGRCPARGRPRAQVSHTDSVVHHTHKTAFRSRA